MPSAPPEVPAVSPLLTAGLLLAALPLLRQLDLIAPTAAQVLERTGASRSRAYEIKAAVEAALPEMQRPPGRPPAERPAPALLPDLAGAVLDYLRAHPGSMVGDGGRRRYSDGMRRFILQLCERHREVPLDAFAAAVRVPESTLRGWLRGEVVPTEALPENLATLPPRLDPTGPQLQTLLAEHDRWRGSFTDFCDHIQTHWRLPFGRTLIGTILEANGVRVRRRRPGRSPDEDAIRGQIERFFPNAQWVGDGSELIIEVNGVWVKVNLEALIDMASGAVVGGALTKMEDAAAVVTAFEDAEATTGGSPIALLLDNKPSNHCDEVVDGIGDTLLIPATPFRPQNKAHCEGAFGLFKSVAPPLIVDTSSPTNTALSVTRLIFIIWARLLNHRPRRDGRGSRVQRYLDHVPTAEEVQAARAALEERLRRQKLARQTEAARQDPQVRAALADAFVRLGFADPNGNLLNGIARYPLDAVLEGIAIVAGKRAAGTLPAGADARYLMGVVRNVAQEREGWEIALQLWEERSKARDRALAAAEAERDNIDEDDDDTEVRVARYVDRALEAKGQIDRFFWLSAAADTIHDGAPEDQHRHFFRLAARRIHATRKSHYRERQVAARFLAAKLLPAA